MTLFQSDEIFNLPQAKLVFQKQFIPQNIADNLLQTFIETIEWEQGEIMMFGKKVLEPRLTAWYGDAEKSYTYSGKTQKAKIWTPELTELRFLVSEWVMQCLGAAIPDFNSVLLNYYRNGSDSMGYHADNEKELGKNPVIASVNLGQTRRFQFRRKDDKSIKHDIELTHGSLLIMAGEMQHYWQHGIPKEPKKNQPRINLTFRHIY